MGSLGYRLAPILHDTVDRLKGATPTDPRPCSRGLASPCGFASHCKCWFELGIYTPGFFCCPVRGFDPKSGLSFLSSGSTDFVFCPPFCFGAASPGFGGFRLHSHDMHDLGSQRGGWFSPPPRAAPVGLCPSLTLKGNLCYQKYYLIWPRL